MREWKAKIKGHNYGIKNGTRLLSRNVALDR
jgi:hypothetical protein